MNRDLMSLLWPLVDAANKESGVTDWLRSYVARTVATPLLGRLAPLHTETRLETP